MSNLKKPTRASKRDVLELAILRYNKCTWKTSYTHSTKAMLHLKWLSCVDFKVCKNVHTFPRMDVQSPFATTAIQFCWVSAGCVLKLLSLWRYKTRKNKFCLFTTAAAHRLSGRLLTSQWLPYCLVEFSLWDNNLGREHSRNDFSF